MSHIIRTHHTMTTIITFTPSPLFFQTTKPLSLPRRRLRLRFAVRNTISGGSGEGGGGLKKVVSGMVDSKVEEILNREENKGLLDGLQKASERVERAKREFADIERRENETKEMREYIAKLETRATEIAECQKEILEARALVEEAERSLTAENEESSKNEERLESAKAASVSALVGTLAGLPFYLTQVTDTSQVILPLAVTFVSCALFGVTFRYVVRRDLDDFHLKTGAAAAFGVVRGLALLESGPPLELEPGSLFVHAFNGAIYVSENLLVFVFATVALDFCFKMRLVKPFPNSAIRSRD